MSAKAVQRFVGRAARKTGKDGRDESGMLTESAFDQIEDDAMARAALVDWRGLEDDGKPVAFSPEMAAELLSLQPFWNAVRNSVNHVSAEALAALEQLAKNSKAPSRGKQRAA